MDRKQFLMEGSHALLGSWLAASLGNDNPRPGSNEVKSAERGSKERASAAEPLLLFLAGDVMTGRGIDQILPHSVDPELYETYVKTAKRYVQLAKQQSGSIPDNVSYNYIWGDALNELERAGPDARIINLETSITTKSDYWRQKRIHYRMHPENIRVLTEAGIDCCVLGNNHVLDWGYAGLKETLQTIRKAGIITAGAGANEEEAARPGSLKTGSGRLLIFSYAAPSAGAPLSWEATGDRAGLNVLSNLNPNQAEKVIADIESSRHESDRVIVSLHWGSNWGYEVPNAHQEFARRLIDAGAADIIYGHSSHHPKGIEVYKERLILYGCGDLINDYEGISGHEKYRGDLSLMYFPRLNEQGKLISLKMTPMRIRRFRLHHASNDEAQWLFETLNRICEPFDTSVEIMEEGRLKLNFG